MDRLHALGFLPDSADARVRSLFGESDTRSGDACVRPTPGMGVNNVGLDFAPTTNANAPGTYEERGAPAKVLHDLANLGAGFGRQLGPSDLQISILFPDRPIPPPDEILSALQDEPLQLIPFTLALLLAMSRDVALTPTLFCWGGGSALNEAQSTPDAEIGATGVTWSKVLRACPIT